MMRMQFSSESQKNRIVGQCDINNIHLFYYAVIDC